jgi:hypothetical protein
VRANPAGPTADNNKVPDDQEAITIVSPEDDMLLWTGRWRPNERDEERVRSLRIWTPLYRNYYIVCTARKEDSAVPPNNESMAVLARKTQPCLWPMISGYAKNPNQNK